MNKMTNRNIKINDDRPIQRVLKLIENNHTQSIINQTYNKKNESNEVLLTKNILERNYQSLSSKKLQPLNRKKQPKDFNITKKQKLSLNSRNESRIRLSITRQKQSNIGIEVQSVKKNQKKLKLQYIQKLNIRNQNQNKYQKLYQNMRNQKSHQIQQDQIKKNLLQMSICIKQQNDKENDKNQLVRFKNIIQQSTEMKKQQKKNITTDRKKNQSTKCLDNNSKSLKNIPFNPKSNKQNKKIKKNYKLQIVLEYAIAYPNDLMDLNDINNYLNDDKRRNNQNKRCEKQTQTDYFNYEKWKKEYIQRQKHQKIKFFNKCDQRFRDFDQLINELEKFQILKREENKKINLTNKINQIEELQKKFYNDMNKLKQNFKNNIEKNKQLQTQFKIKLNNLQEELIMCIDEPKAIEVKNILKKFQNQLGEKLFFSIKSINKFIVEYEKVELDFIYWTDCLKEQQNKQYQLIQQIQKLQQISMRMFGTQSFDKQFTNSQKLNQFLSMACERCYDYEQKLRRLKKYNLKIEPILKYCSSLKKKTIYKPVEIIQ